VLGLACSLVPEREIVTPEAALARDRRGPVELLAVGRLAPEKDPLALLAVLDLLRARGGAWRLTIAGDGPLRGALEREVAARGLCDAVRLLGEVPNGPELWARYRAADAFVHLARTEGLPQVLVEAHAAGLPVVATRVGGVPGALGHGARGLLVEAGEPAAAAAALERLAGDPALRRRLVLAGLEHARDQSLERQLDRLATFAHAAASATRSQRYRSNASVRKSPATR
jgi:glycosyltransferase involved in cell wall biosynthesis